MRGPGRAAAGDAGLDACAYNAAFDDAANACIDSACGGREASRRRRCCGGLLLLPVLAGVVVTAALLLYRLVLAAGGAGIDNRAGLVRGAQRAPEGALQQTDALQVAAAAAAVAAEGGH